MPEDIVLRGGLADGDTYLITRPMSVLYVPIVPDAYGEPVRDPRMTARYDRTEEHCDGHFRIYRFSGMTRIREP